MNKTYRSVWNEARGAWVAASELGGGRRKGAQRAAVGVALMLLAMGAAQGQVKIGNNPTTINPGSALEIETPTRGVLMPRVALTDRATWTLIVDDEEIKLWALEFELALEFFHHIGQVLARSYLLSVASSLSPGGSGAWLNDCIEVLSDKLDLRPSRGCEWLLAPVRSQGYRLTRAKPPNCHFQKDMQGAARVLAD